MITNTHKSFLLLVRLGIGHTKTTELTNKVDWDALKALADSQGLSATILDGIGCLPESMKPPKLELLQWIGEVFQNYEQRYAQYEKAISSLAGWYNQHGYKMMVLKGYACSLDWPNPKHRPCGDIDIWQFGKQKEADALIESLEFRDEGLESVHEGQKFKKIKIDRSHHHHTVFYWNEFMVENHYDFVNVHHSKSNAAIEKVFKELGMDDSFFVMLNNERLYLPSPNLHALFLLRHAMMEFASSGLNVRQLLDWAFFVEKHKKEIDWDWLLSVLEEFYMMDFFNCINAICIEDLGFECSIFPKLQFNPIMKKRVLKEIISPEVPNIKPKQFVCRVIWKYKRWKANEWKHKLCYKESMWSAFWSGVWSHLLKPSSI